MHDLLRALGAAEARHYLLAAIVIAAAIAHTVHRERKARARALDWLVRNGYRPRRIEVRWLRKGPFFLTASKYQLVYRLEVDDLRLRERRRGWARIGGWWTGLLSDDVEVRWDAAAEPLPDARRASSVADGPDATSRGPRPSAPAAR